MYIKRYGQGLLEYSLGLALVAIVCVGGLQMLGGGINKGFNDILPASWQSPVLKKDVSTVSTNTTPLTNNTLTNNTTLQTSQITGFSESSNPVLQQYQSIVQTAGSLGDEKAIFSYSDQMVSIAAKYEQTDPALFNEIVQLGIQGKQMAIAMNAWQLDPNNMTTGQSYADLATNYGWMGNNLVYTSVFNRLSPQDQAQVSSLFGTSNQLAKDVLDTNGGMINASMTVDQNSNQIVTCGQNMQCQ
jgi:hypothetical protein